MSIMDSWFKSASRSKGLRRFGSGVLLVGAIAGVWQASVAGETVWKISPPVLDEPAGASHTETVVLAGGCFWGVQGVFQHVNGVLNAVSGYAGGSAQTAQYETVSTGRTGHAESVQITFDPSKVSYGHLLQIYFSVVHDPTELNRQGPDSGTQYRSTIFPTTAEQRKVAQAYIDQLNKSGVYPKAIATTVEDLKGFYPAEGYHQNFLTNNPTQPYIVFNDLPKVANLKATFPSEYRNDPVLVAQK
jgi:peptide-methionine (S)-S-oxide reductase